MILTITFHLYTTKPLTKIYNPEKKSLITTQLSIKTFTCIIYTSQYIIYISKIYKSLSQNQHRFTLSHTLAGTPLFDFQLQANHLFKNLPSLKKSSFSSRLFHLQIRRADPEPRHSDDHQRLADIRHDSGAAIVVGRGPRLLPAAFHRHSNGADNRRHVPGRAANTDHYIPLREARDTRPPRHERLVQATYRILLGLRASQGQHIQLRHVRRVLATVRHSRVPQLVQTDKPTCPVQPGLVRPLQILFQQSDLLRGGQALQKRVRQAFPLLLLQNNGEFLEEDARGGGPEH